MPVEFTRVPEESPISSLSPRPSARPGEATFTSTVHGIRPPTQPASRAKPRRIPGETADPRLVGSQMSSSTRRSDDLDFALVSEPMGASGKRFVKKRSGTLSVGPMAETPGTTPRSTVPTPLECGNGRSTASSYDGHARPPPPQLHSATSS